MAVVLIPGFMLDDDLWSEIAPALQQFSPLVNADLAAGHSIEEVARRVLQTAPDTFFLVGFSMGGYVAREIARMAPDRVERLVLVATSSRGDEALHAHRQSEASHMQAEAFRGISRASIRQSLAPDREQDAALIERIQRMSAKLSGGAFQKQAAIRRTADTDRLDEIQAPTMIVAGRYDRLRSLDESCELHEGIKDSHLVIIDAGHMVPLEAPEGLAKAMLVFFAS